MKSEKGGTVQYNSMRKGDRNWKKEKMNKNKNKNKNEDMKK